MNIGDACVCSPTRIDSQAQQIIVRLGAGKAEARCPFDEAFSQAGAPYSVYSGSLCTRHHDDVVELDRPFVAEVTSLNPLTVSRRRRLNTLWSELEAAAGQDRLFLAQVHRQRSDSYRLLLEGNLMFWAEKAPLESYLSECGYKGLQLRRMTPQEGDMVPLKILSADRTSQHVSVDLASPLTRLQTDNLSAELLHILEVPSHLAASPSGPAPRVTHPRSDFNIPNLGNAPVILVVDDDEHFRAFLVQELSLLGATASHCEPLKVVEALTAGNFTHLLVDVDMHQVRFDSVIQLIRQHKPSLLPRVVVMSALSEHDALASDPSLTLQEVLTRHAPTLPFWPKLLGGLNHSLCALASIITGDLSRENPQLHLEHPSAKSSATVPPRPAEGGESDIQDTLRRAAADLQRLVQADAACLFAFDISSWCVTVYSPTAAVELRAQDPEAQSYLPYSPIRDLSYLSEDWLACEDSRRLTALPGAASQPSNLPARPLSPPIAPRFPRLRFPIDELQHL